MLTIRAMSDGSGYSERHLQHSDYYAEGERVVGTWQGRGAELLGLSGEVEPTDFEGVRQGLDPSTGNFLRQRHSAHRIRADGTVQSRGRNLYDFTISAPKSVSVMAKVGGDEGSSKPIEKPSTRHSKSWNCRQRVASERTEETATAQPAIWCLRSITMTPAANLTLSYIPMRLQPT